MKRLEVRIEEDLDEALAVEAARRKTSKAALIREFIGEKLGRHDAASDRMASLIGDIDGEPGDIDDVVYRV